MKLVIDTNCIMSALIKNSISREIILNQNFNFYTPDFTLEEIRNHKPLICEKADINSEEFEILLSILFEKIEIIPNKDYYKFIKQSEKLLPDIEDVPFLACAMAVKADIWSDDRHFENQDKVKIWKTKSVIKFL